MNSKSCFALCAFFLLTISGLAQIPEDVKGFIRGVLLQNNPKIDTVTSVESLSHIIILEKRIFANQEIGIYKFGWNYSNISTNYILIADGLPSTWKVYGIRSLETDLVELKIYLDQRMVFKDATKLACYEYLVENYHWR